MVNTPVRYLFTTCEGTDCYLEIRPSAGTLVSVAPYVRDGFVLRAVLDESGVHPTYHDAQERAAVLAALEFLERRFGPIHGPPLPCSDRHRFVKALHTPLRWGQVLRRRP
jgi:hypothetical protein